MRRHPLPPRSLSTYDILKGGILNGRKKRVSEAKKGPLAGPALLRLLLPLFAAAVTVGVQWRKGRGCLLHSARRVIGALDSGSHDQAMCDGQMLFFLFFLFDPPLSTRSNWLIR